MGRFGHPLLRKFNKISMFFILFELSAETHQHNSVATDKAMCEKYLSKALTPPLNDHTPTSTPVSPCRQSGFVGCGYIFFCDIGFFAYICKLYYIDNNIINY